MADPARTNELPESPLAAPEPDDGAVLDEKQVLETLEGSDPTPTIDAPKGIAIAMGIGAAIWLVAFAVYVIVW
jgi:hypothetical protein